MLSESRDAGGELSEPSNTVQVTTRRHPFRDLSSSGGFVDWFEGPTPVAEAIRDFADIVGVWFWDETKWLLYSREIPAVFNVNFTLIDGSVLWVVQR